jgi:hypothetical protein
MYGIYMPNNPDLCVGHLIVVRGRIAVLPRHYIDLIDGLIDDHGETPESFAVLKSNGDRLPLSVAFKYFLEAAETDYTMGEDLCAFALPSHVHCHVDITKCFITEANLAKPIQYNTTLVVNRSGRPTNLLSTAYACSNRPVESPTDSWTLKRAFKYHCGTRPGDCGSPFILSNTAVGPGKVLGLHVAGHEKGQGIGIAATLSYENLMELLEMFDDSSVESITDTVVMNDLLTVSPQHCMDLPGYFAPIGTISTPVHQPKRSKIRRSKLFEAWGPSITKPAHLGSFLNGSGVAIDPMNMAVSKYGHVPTVFPASVYQVAVDSYFGKLLKIRTKHERAFHVFSFEEAVCGVPGVPFCESLPRSTSAGFPHVLGQHPGFPGKTWFFGKDTEFDLSRPQCADLKAQCENIISDALLNKRHFHPFVDFLKDERRPIAKAELGKTRLISCAPLPLVILTRMYFLDFNMFMMQQCITSGCTVGINPYSLQWSELAANWSEHGANVMAGDFENFDGSHFPQLMSMVGWAIVQFMGGSFSDQRVRWILWSELVHSVHLNHLNVYQWLRGLPSGHPLTAILNSIIVQVHFRAAWIHLNPDRYLGIQAFDDYVNCGSFGDDNVVNVSGKVIDFFNPFSISRFFSTMNIRYTNEDKSLVTEAFRDLSNITFLKRSFRYSKKHRRYLAPLALETILEMPYWYRVCAHPILLTESIVDTALMELSLHPREVFEKWSSQIIDASKRLLPYSPPIQSYELLQELTFDREDCW